MYDKVRLWLPRRRGLPNIAPLLDAATEAVNRTTGEVRVSGRLGNLRVEEKPSGVVVEGSLGKYLNGDNIRPLTRHGAAEAVEKLSDALGVDIGPARVLAVEFGRTYEMSRPPAEYLALLGRLPRMDRIAAACGTLYYRAGSTTDKTRRELAFYDKGAEAGASGNLLRYEMKFAGRLSEQLHAPGLNAAMLTEPPFYGYMVERYKKYYEMIEKTTRGALNMDAIRTPTDAFNALAGLLIGRADPSEVAALVEEIKAGSGFDRLQMSRLRKRINDSQRLAAPSASGVEELGEKVRAAGEE